MKKLFQLKNLCTLIFLVLLLLFFLLGFKALGSTVLYGLRTIGIGGTLNPANLESHYLDRMSTRFEPLITLNGGVERLLGKRYVNDRYRLDCGNLVYTIPELDMSENAARTIAFRDTLREQGIPFVYVNAPFSIDTENKQLPPGIEDYGNENADRFLQLLRQADVDVVDLRELEKADGLDHYENYFRTDHHWRPEMGLWAAGKIQQSLGEMYPDFASDPALCASENYTVEIRENSFLGSNGRRVGPWYAGYDDMSILHPQFETALEVHFSRDESTRRGDLEQCLYFPEVFDEKDPFQASQYNFYCGGDEAMHIRNLAGEQGLPVQDNGKKVLLIKDSCSLVVIPYLSLCFSEMRTYDMRIEDASLEAVIEAFQPDLVMVLYNPGALEDNNWNMFYFS